MKFVLFSVSENGENGLGDEGADGAMPPQNFWARTAPVLWLQYWSCNRILDTGLKAVVLM